MVTNPGFNSEMNAQFPAHSPSHYSGRGSGRMGAYVLIGIGVFGLLAGTGVLKLIGGLFGGLVLAALAYFAYNEGRRNRNTLWRVAPYPLAGLAIAAIVPAGLGAGAFLAGLGLAFAVAWRDDQTRWWALIPAGALASLGAVEFFSRVMGWYPSWLFLIGLAATFYSLTRLGIERQPWAIYPAFGLAVLAVLSFTTSGGWVVPLALIGIGAWLLTRGR